MKSIRQIFALVDCNNFYYSCEMVFNPKLEGKPLIVMTNNDGCAVAGSEEAKQFIPMVGPGGIPLISKSTKGLISMHIYGKKPSPPPTHPNS